MLGLFKKKKQKIEMSDLDQLLSLLEESCESFVVSIKPKDSSDFCFAWKGPYLEKAGHIHSIESHLTDLDKQIFDEKNDK